MAEIYLLLSAFSGFCLNYPPLIHLTELGLIRDNFAPSDISGRLAQLGERRVRNAEVGGSIPPPSTNNTGSIPETWETLSERMGFYSLARPDPLHYQNIPNRNT